MDPTQLPSDSRLQNSLSQSVTFRPPSNPLRPFRIWIGLVIVTLIVATFSLGLGPVSIPLRGIVLSVAGKPDALTESQGLILWQLRFPRILVASIVGYSLAAAGIGFQSLFRNPLADPYIIGASSGAAFGIAIGSVSAVHWLYLGIGTNTWLAMIGSLTIVSIVLLTGRFASHDSSNTLLLTGVALSSMTNALVSLVLFWNDEKAMVVLTWLMGSFANSTWNMIGTASIPSVIGVVWLTMHARQMDAYLLGEISASTLGLDVKRYRRSIVIGASLATAGAVAMAGIIGFVGLLAPQLARILVGARHRWLIPVSGTLGALLINIADTIARIVVIPTELPVGIVTALLGAPSFLVLLLRQQNARQ